MTRPRTGYAFLDAGLDQPGSVLAFAHRGGAFHPALEGLENTLTAFQHAVDLGYRYLETDVHVSRDGVLLAFHDAVLDRVADVTGTLADLDYADVSRAVIGGREAIPTMSSLFEMFPQTCFNIDLKSDAAVGPLAALIASTNAYDRVCVGSFSQGRMRRFRSTLGRVVATAAAPLEVGLFLLPPTNRLVDVLTRGGSPVLQVPHRHKGLQIVTEAFIARAHAAGKPVHVWTIDDPAEMDHLLDLGVDGLMTDRTDVLRAVLVRRGQWMGAHR